LVFIAGLFFYFNRANRDTITFITQASGYISLIILTISLIIGSVNLLLKYKNPISTYLRRDISIIGGTLAVIHSITGLFVHLRGKNWQYFLNKTEYGYSIRLDNFGLANYTGLISALIIILLLIISNDYLFRKMSPTKWKNIQRLSYLCLFYNIVFIGLSKKFKSYLSLLYTTIYITLTFQMVGVWLKLTKQKDKL
jgi:sulfoxide reductase heme-binding subunit YedZ